MAIASVQNVEELLAHTTANKLLLRHLASTEVIALLNHGCHLGEFLRNLIRHLNLQLHPVVLLREAAHLLHVLLIVCEVMVRVHRSHIVKSANLKSLTVHIGKAERTDYILQSASPAILLHLVDEGSRNLNVVNEVKPSEAHSLQTPCLVSTLVDDSSNTSHRLPVTISDIILSLAESESRVLVASQRVNLTHFEIWDIGWRILVKFGMESDELLEFFVIANSFNYNIRHCYIGRFLTF